MQVGAIVTVSFPPDYKGTSVTVIAVGKTRALVELPNGSQTWIAVLDMKGRSRKSKAA